MRNSLTGNHHTESKCDHQLDSRLTLLNLIRRHMIEVQWLLEISDWKSDVNLHNANKATTGTTGANSWSNPFFPRAPIDETLRYGNKDGRALISTVSRAFHSLPATKRQWTEGRSISPVAPSHIDPYGALFNCIGSKIDPSLSAAVNILLSVPPSWSIAFF